MFCTKCGAKLEEGSAFCDKCGANISATDLGYKEPDPSAKVKPKKETRFGFILIGTLILLAALIIGISTFVGYFFMKHSVNIVVQNQNQNIGTVEFQVDDLEPFIVPAGSAAREMPPMKLKAGKHTLKASCLLWQTSLEFKVSVPLYGYNDFTFAAKINDGGRLELWKISRKNLHVVPYSEDR